MTSAQVKQFWSPRVLPCCRGAELSSARVHTQPDDVATGLAAMRDSIEYILESGYTSWSLENVSTPIVRDLLNEYTTQSPEEIAWCTVDCVDYGVPQNRRRLIAGPPKMIQYLRETPVKRISIAQAFHNAGAPLPAQYIKNGTRSRKGTACIRSVHEFAHTVTASHPLTFCDADGTTVRCLTVQETAILQGFPKEWMLPTGQRSGIRALGNAVPPPLGAAIMNAACAARRAQTTH
jgi:site-specific DNA-cytosine methylase